MAWLLSCSIKAALLLAASWFGATLLRRSTAAARHQIWTLGVVTGNVIPRYVRTHQDIAVSTSAAGAPGSLTAGRLVRSTNAPPHAGHQSYASGKRHG